MRRRKMSNDAGPASSIAEKAAAAAAAAAAQHDDSAGGNVSDDGKQAAAAAGDLLQLAAAASSCSSGGRARSTQPGARQRDAKPYQRRGGARAGRGGRDERSDDSWLPGGLWWKDNSTPMPSGRQPGELAGWQPLAGDLTQQRLQEQREALSQKEQLVRVRALPSGSRLRCTQPSWHTGIRARTKP